MTGESGPYDPFEETGRPFSERAEPSEYFDAVGRVVFFHSELRKRILGAIGTYLGWSEEGEPLKEITMPVDDALELLWVLVCNRRIAPRAVRARVPKEKAFAQLMVVCQQADRRAVEVLDDLKRSRELDSGAILDRADYLCHVVGWVEQLFEQGTPP